MKRSKTQRWGWILGAVALLVFAGAALAEDDMPMQPPPQQQQQAKPGMGGGGGMGGMGGGGGMPMEPMDMMEMGGMGMKPGAMEPMDSQMMGMMEGSAAMQSPLPGFPGASHLYHVGSTDFFLDHAAMSGLTVEQKRRLGQVREQSQMEGATFDRRILQAEQELWQLTAADQPDAAAIDTKVREIETLRGDKRLAFIRAVGGAAEVLTPAQRQKVLGMTSK
jgi:Spy/CpxP family protein refolding chaperone